jgi:hypothetical protein
MPHTLTVSDGTTTVDLNGGSAILLEYTPRVPSRTDNPHGSVVDNAAVVLFTTKEAGRVAEQQLNDLFHQAREKQKSGVGPRVYVNFKPDGDTNTYRSELYAEQSNQDIGRVTHGDGTLDYLHFGDKFLLNITWERRFYWEGPRTAIGLTNGNGTTASPLTIYNHNDSDSGHDNYVQIAASAIKGDLPAPLELQLVNTYNSATRVGRITVSHNVRSDPANVNLIIEGESATGGSGTNTANAFASGGFYREIAVPDAETLLAEFPLSGALLAQLAGNRFRVQARFSAAPSTCYVRVAVRLAGLSTLWGGNSTWRQLGIIESGELTTIADGIPLPPYQVGSSSLGEISLAIFGRGGAGVNILLDFLQLSPLDSWREYRDAGYGLPYTASLTDDPVNERLYANFGSGELGNYVAYGSPIMVWRNRVQRLYFLWKGQTGSAATDRTMTVQAWYRPRRIALASEA